jgi:hypothetical protein
MRAVFKKFNFFWYDSQISIFFYYEFKYLCMKLYVNRLMLWYQYCLFHAIVFHVKPFPLAEYVYLGKFEAVLEIGNPFCWNCPDKFIFI